MSDYKTVRMVIEAEVVPDADEATIAEALVAAAEERDDVLAAWTAS